jgi:hypothetical protein
MTRWLGAVVALGCVLAGVIAACSASPKLSGEGGDCRLATDCQAGLVCVAEPDGRRICTSDLSRIQRLYEAGSPPSDASAEGGEGGVGDGAVRDAPEPPVDAQGQDAAAE